MIIKIITGTDIEIIKTDIVEKMGTALVCSVDSILYRNNQRVTQIEIPLKSEELVDKAIDNLFNYGIITVILNQGG